MDRDEMYKTNQERVRWGVDTGRLKKTSKGVSKLAVDGVPCLLQDIETREGGLLQMYSFFVPEYPRMGYSVQIMCDDTSTYNKHAKDLASIINSITVVRNSQK
jgi:coenzyme F420-reducing hydrogenase beta subunit